jgi:membrane-associated protease RseP (regulator of RpoE activity)
MSSTLPPPPPPAPPPERLPPLPPPAPAGGPAPAAGPEETPTGQTLLRLGMVVGLLLLLGVAVSWWAVLVVVALLIMIFLHELGHFMTARWTGMKATEFFIGFGPRIWSMRRGETEYGLKAIPAGAYVRIIGMNNLEEVEPEEEARTYRAKGYPQRVLVASAGSLMHFLLAIVLLFTVLMTFGQPREDVWNVATIVPESPAAEAGVQLGDQVVAIDGAPVVTYDDMRDLIRDRPGDEVTLTVLRDGSTVDLRVELADVNPQGEPVGFLGVSAVNPNTNVTVTEAVPETFRTFWFVTEQSVLGLGRIFSPSGITEYVDTVTSARPGDGSASVDENPNRPLSPIGAVSIGSQLAQSGAERFLLFLAAVNIFIGIFNLVPLLPFDGGHIAVATYEAIRSRKGKRYYADVRKLLPLTYAVVGVLLLFFIGNVYLDLADPISLR